MSIKSRYIRGLNNETFWSTIKTPIYEKIDDDNVLVTFLVKGKIGTTYVLLSSIAGYDLKENVFNHLRDDIFYQSIVAPKKFIATYQIAEDIPLDFDEYYENRDQYLDNVYPDPLNPEQYIWPENTDYEDEGAVMSIVQNGVETLKINDDTPKGQVDRLQFKSDLLENERVIRVYKPHGYNENIKYPVLFFTDGFAYTHVTKTPLILDRLIETKQIKPVVAVFINSPYRGARDVELTCNDDFADMVALELLPWIKENYSVTDKSEETAICGASFGGLFASFLAFKHSALFGNVLSQSGAYWYSEDERELLTKMYKQSDKLPVKIYMNVGKLEHEDLMVKTNIRLYEILKEKDYSCKLELFDGGHDHLSWDYTLPQGLKYLFGL